MPGRKCLWLGAGSDPEDYRPAAEELLQLAPRFLVQAWIEGGDEDVCFYLAAVGNDGSVLDEVCGRKWYQWQPLTGSTAVCQAVRDDDLRHLGRELLLASGLRGLGSVEFKRDRRDGVWYITEPTVGRNDHQSAVAMAAGHNPTEALVCDVLELARRPGRERLPSPLWIDEIATVRYCRQERAWMGLARLLVRQARHGIPRPLLYAPGDGRPLRGALARLRRRGGGR